MDVADGVIPREPSGRSPKTIYAVLKKRIKSAHVSQAIAEAKKQIQALKPARRKAA